MGSDNKPGEKVPFLDGNDDKPGEVVPFSSSSVLRLCAVCCAVQLMGVGIALAVFKSSPAYFGPKLLAAISEDQHWVAAAFAVVAFGVRFVNFYPMEYKKHVMKGKMRDELGLNMRSNPFIFRVFGTITSTVLFDNEGVIGQYNRANRSLGHMVENFGSILCGLVLAGSVFPFPTFVCASAFGIGRILHQIGYVTGYGKHAGGFLLSTLGTVAMEGLVCLIAIAGFGLLSVPPPSPLAPPVDDRLSAIEASLKTIAAQMQAAKAAAA